MQSPLTSLLQCSRQHIRRHARQLDIHLNRTDALACTRNLEIHVAEMILVAENIAQDPILVALIDQAHRNPRDGCLDWNTGVHQSETAAAYGGHR
jgi:hypothetical protein